MVLHSVGKGSLLGKPNDLAFSDYLNVEVNGMLSDEMREELVQGLTDIFRNNISMIILYGSVARGDATGESDIDIAIVVRSQMDDVTKRRFLSWAADMDIRYERVFSIVDIQESNMKKWEDLLPFYQNVKREGIILWKAA
ncbi:MAG TPA: nucleotidyltransferase domain-containing protein [Lachnospiraceae bacterium]|nr:nucleotidyltransferase domain-containing protein [Lachnospiraceae bacterium]